MGEILKTTAVAAAAAIAGHEQLKSEKEKMAESYKISEESNLRFSAYSEKCAREKYGDNVPLGTVYSTIAGSQAGQTVTKPVYMRLVLEPGPFQIQYLSDAKGWNPEWGDKKTELAYAKRDMMISKAPSRKKELMEKPLSYFELPEQRYEYKVRDSSFAGGYRIVHTGDKEEALRMQQKEQEMLDRESDQQLIRLVVGLVSFLVVLALLFGGG